METKSTLKGVNMKKIHYTQDERLAVITLDDGKMNTMNWDFFELGFFQ